MYDYEKADMQHLRGRHPMCRSLHLDFPGDDALAASSFSGTDNPLKTHCRLQVCAPCAWKPYMVTQWPPHGAAPSTQPNQLKQPSRSPVQGPVIITGPPKCYTTIFFTLPSLALCVTPRHPLSCRPPPHPCNHSYYSVLHMSTFATT